MMTGGLHGTPIRVSSDRYSYQHPQRDACDATDAGGCGWIVEQHQNFEAPEDADIPEFTIEVAYKAEDRNANVAPLPGWRYVLKWKENGVSKQSRNYGYDNKEAAVRGAKRAAEEIARQLQPVHIETFTPEV